MVQSMVSVVVISLMVWVSIPHIRVLGTPWDIVFPDQHYVEGRASLIRGGEYSLNPKPKNPINPTP